MKMNQYSNPDENQQHKVAEPAAMYGSDVNTLRNRGVEMLMNIEDARVLSLIVHGMESTMREQTDRQQFCQHLEQWKKETGVISNPLRIVSNAHFQAIAQMGRRAVPYILDEISDSPSLLYHALELIYGEELTKSEKNGTMVNLNIKDSCKTWIERLKQ